MGDAWQNVLAHHHDLALRALALAAQVGQQRHAGEAADEQLTVRDCARPPGDAIGARGFCHGPYRSGRLRHGAPVRSSHSTVDHLPMITPRTTAPIHLRQQGLYSLPRRVGQLTSTCHKINDQSARARTPARGPSRTGSAGRWSAMPSARTACRFGSSARRFLPPEDGATAYPAPPCPESQRALPTVPRPARCEQPAAASRPLVAAFFSPVLAPAQSHWSASEPQGNWIEHAHSCSVIICQTGPTSRVTKCAGHSCAA